MTRRRRRRRGLGARGSWLLLWCLGLYVGIATGTPSDAVREVEVAAVGVGEQGTHPHYQLPSTPDPHDHQQHRQQQRDHPPAYLAREFVAIVGYVKVNHHYILPSEDGRMSPSPLIARTIRRSLHQLLEIRVRFRPEVDFHVLSSVVGQLTLRHRNASDVALRLRLTAIPNALRVVVDLGRSLARVPHFTPGIYRLQLGLGSLHVTEPLVLTLAELDLTAGHRQLGSPPSLHLSDLWSGRLLRNFVRRCEIDPAFEGILESRLVWGELLITAFAVAYCGAVHWLGPLDFTPWQQRCYQGSCLASAAFQVIFGGWLARYWSIRVAFPLSLVVGFLYFAAFNATNILILLEQAQDSDDDDGNVGEAVSSSTATTRRARGGREILGIPAPADLHGMSRVVMIGYKKARFH